MTHRKGAELRGWLNVATGKFWPLPAGFKEPDWTVATEWVRVYEGDEIVGAHSVRRSTCPRCGSDEWDYCGCFGLPLV